MRWFVTGAGGQLATEFERLLTGEVFLADCFVPSDRLLGMHEKAVGRDSGKDVFHSERTGMAPMAIGIIERCLEIALDYAKQRVTWGKKIAEYLVAQKII